MRDIVYVQEGKEQPFIDTAVALGYESLTLIYTKKPKNTPHSQDIKLSFGLTEKSGMDEQLVLGTSKSQLSKSATLLCDNEFEQEKDFVHQRRSGLNHVSLQFCKQHHITILFNHSKLRKQPAEKLSTYFGRMKQNTLLCKKYGVTYEVVSLAHTIDEMRKATDVLSFTRLL